MCGVAAYYSAREKICGAESYNSGQGPVCGVKGFNKSRGAACGVELYVAKKDKDICGFDEKNIGNSGRMHGGPPDFLIDYKKQECVNAGFDDLRVQESDNTMGGREHNISMATFTYFCQKFKSCRNSSFGVELYRECSHPDFGTIYATCENAVFGVKNYKECEHPSFGIKSYKKCRHESFGRDCVEYAQ
ncbi:MAG: hypothetical protein HQK53_11960 [Oligoflexia bacterium]|nr:hypothetical protein [Oligoflexia bacterium]